MKVRILSGNQKGAVVEMGQTEAESAIGTGFAEAVVEAPPEKAEEEAKAPRLRHK